ncbi:MAG: hypothetical protein LBD91_08465 [Prevotellaceae bacterium]|jgi:hypothetical protein|nr:hypothetical protein [Prevotellaceae bacterium]
MNDVPTMNDVPSLQHILSRRLPTSFANEEEMLAAAQMLLPDNAPESLDVGDIYNILKYKPIKRIDTTMKYETLAGTPEEIIQRLQSASESEITVRKRRKQRFIIPDNYDPEYASPPDDQQSEWGLYQFDTLHKLSFWIRVALLALLVLLVIRVLRMKQGAA